PGSGATVELASIPEGVSLGIMPISNHVMLVGDCPADKIDQLPTFSIGGYPGHPTRNDPFGIYTRKEGEDPGVPADSWTDIETTRLIREARGDFYLRFDGRPIKVGDEVVELEFVTE
ncbi:MAG: hypothetical protein AAGF12_37225, partial [Myxococcota bacterium]